MKKLKTIVSIKFGLNDILMVSSSNKDTRYLLTSEYIKFFLPNISFLSPLFLTVTIHSFLFVCSSFHQLELLVDDNCF